MRAVLAVFLCMAALAGPARAASIPAEVLDKDYASCMAGEDPQKSPERNHYCLCVRDSMKGWSLEAYGKLAEQESKAHDAAHMPAQLQQIAKACIAKVMH